MDFVFILKGFYCYYCFLTAVLQVGTQSEILIKAEESESESLLVPPSFGDKQVSSSLALALALAMVLVRF